MDPDDPERLIDSSDGLSSPAASASEGALDLRRLERIFTEAWALSGRARQDFLARACSGDDLLRQRVDRLLAEDAKDGDDPGSDPTLPGLPAPLPGSSLSLTTPSRLGPFTILRVLGEGGMGVVYEAVQNMPRRKVALKVIRPGMISREVLSRFRYETDILGRLEHPGIAHIYAAGETDGAPWFAMEFVRGVTLDRYVAAEAPDARRLLELFVEICDAVHHAHQRGIVHRDLKPSNVLIAEGGQPKVLDFGVARATDGASATMHTTAGQIVGTLSYMSPEQMSGSAHLVDRRSDVYALGVMLYELLSGRLPHPVAGLPLPEVFRVIRDEEPSRLGSIDTRFRGDLETITAKALAKDPERRYATTAELAADLTRHLSDEPILARDPSTFYQLRKFARRNRALVAGVMATLVVLALGTVVSTTFAVREAAAKRRAERAGYRSAVAAAAGEIAALNGSRAREFLDQAPASLRGWEWRYLRWLSDRSLLTLDSGEKFGLPACSPDGRRVAAIGSSGEVHLWDLETGQKLPWRAGRIPPSTTSRKPHRILAGFSIVLLWNAATNTAQAVESGTGRVLWRSPIVTWGSPWGPATRSPAASRRRRSCSEVKTGRAGPSPGPGWNSPGWR
jgi:predicted Ser/Thr protein kinase